MEDEKSKHSFVKYLPFVLSFFVMLSPAVAMVIGFVFMSSQSYGAMQGLAQFSGIVYGLIVGSVISILLAIVSWAIAINDEETKFRTASLVIDLITFIIVGLIAVIWVISQII